MMYTHVVQKSFPVLAMLALLLTTSTSNAQGTEQDICPNATKIAPPLVKSHMLSRCLKDERLSRSDRFGLIKQRATAYLELGRYEQALTDFNAVLEFMPDDAEIYNSLGIIHKRLGNYDQAKNNYALAQKLRPALTGPIIIREPQPITDITAPLAINPVKIEAISNKRIYAFEDSGQPVDIEHPLAINEELKYPVVDERVVEETTVQ